MTLPQLFGQVRRHGFIVTFTNGSPCLKNTKDGAELPPKVMGELKARRQEIIDWFNQPPSEDGPDPLTPTPTDARTEWETCKECRADIAPTMTTDDAKILCNRVGARAARGVPGTNGCPYHPPNSSERGGR